MTCLSTLRQTWPFSVCSKDDNDDDEWPPPWPKIQDNPQQGYTKSKEMSAASSLDFGVANPVTPGLVQMKKGHKVKTSRERLPPIPSLPEQYYGLPPDSRARSPSVESRQRGRNRNKLVKARTQSFHSSKSRPAIGVPSDFRKVAGATSNIIRSDPMPPRRESWRRITRRSSRRAAFRPLQLSIYEPGNELKPLPRFSMLILDSRRQSYMTEAANSRPPSEMPPIPSRFSQTQRRSSLSRKISRSLSRRALTPKMPFTRDNSDDSASDVSFDDLESVVDPDFNPAPVKNRSHAHSEKASRNRVPSPPKAMRLPPPLNTRSLMPPPRDDAVTVSPESPSSRSIQHPSLRLDDLPSAFSSPASPNAPISWPIPPGQYNKIDAAVTGPLFEPMPSAQYAYNTTHKVSTPERSLNPYAFSHSPPKENSSRQSPTPSNESTASTMMTATSNSALSSLTAATAPPSPPQLKQALAGYQPKPQPILTHPIVPLSAHLRDIEVQRVVAETPILQPIPRIPPKSPKRFLPMVLNDQHQSQMPDSPSFRAELSAEKRSVGNAEYARVTQLPSTMQTAYAQYQYEQVQQQQQQNQAKIVRVADLQPTPVPRSIPQQLQPQRPQLHLQTSQPTPQKDWAQTGSAWREVVWGLKRRTQEEAALRMREQQVIIDAIPDTASAHSDSDESARGRDSLWSQKQGRQSYHQRSGSSEKGSGDSAGRRSLGPTPNNVMEVPVGLALGAETEQEPRRAAEASNAALLQMQPMVRHDMHAIAEEDEEDEMDQATPKKMLGVINGMPTAEDSDSSDDDSDNESNASGEEVEFGVEEGLWEMVDSKPSSTRTSIAPARESAALQPPDATTSSRWNRSSRGSVYMPRGAERTSLASEASKGAVPPMPSMPRDVPAAAPRGSRSSQSSRGSRGSMFIPAGFDPVKAGGALALAVAQDTVPPMPPMPNEVTTPSQEQQKTLQQRKPQQWGRGIGTEFGVAY